MSHRTRLAAAAALTAVALLALPRFAAAVPPGNAIFAVDDSGALSPIAVRAGGTFLPAGSNDGGPSASLFANARAALNAAGKRVNVIFGGRTVASVQATLQESQAVITVPGSLHLGGYVAALAATNLGGNATSQRRAPTQPERRAALALVASKLGTTAARVAVRNLTAIDLGHGIALVGTMNLKGTGTPRVDRRVFVVAERVAAGGYDATLYNAQKITVSEPMLEAAAEYLVDTLALENGEQALVTHEVGYDADTYAIYTRSGKTWKSVYGGGGAAM